MKDVAGGVLALIVGLVVIAAVGIGVWQLGWFVEEKNVDRQVRIDNRNKGTQTAWRDEAVKTVADFELVDPDNTAARAALRNKACDLIVRLRPDYRTGDLESFAAREC